MQPLLSGSWEGAFCKGQPGLPFFSLLTQRYCFYLFLLCVESIGKNSETGESVETAVCAARHVKHASINTIIITWPQDWQSPGSVRTESIDSLAYIPEHDSVGTKWGRCVSHGTVTANQCRIHCITYAPFMPPMGQSEAHHRRFSKVREKTTAPAVMRMSSQAERSAFWGRFHSWGLLVCVFVCGRCWMGGRSR